MRQLLMAAVTAFTGAVSALPLCFILAAIVYACGWRPRL